MQISFVCPRDKHPLGENATGLICFQCGAVFPRVRNIPILLDDTSSIFQICDFTSGSEYGGASGYGGTADQFQGLRLAYRKFALKLANPNIPYKFFTADQAIAAVGQQVLHPRILVIGAGDITYHTDDVVYTDVAFGRNVICVCDAHDLPFADHEFDLVIACAVLEHVADPYKCVSEMTRVLRPSGFVYAVTPFLQPVHMGAYDFTRFTYLGHRRLFRCFDDLASGIFGGPASSLAAIIRYTLLSMTQNKAMRSACSLLGLLVAYPLRWLDLMLAGNPSSYDAAFGCVFFGKKRGTAITDRDLLKLYRGGM